MECQRRIDSTLDDDEQSDAWMDQLSDDARLIWSDATALEDIARAWRQGDSDLDPLIQRVDAAVVEGLAALGLPSGQVRAVLVETRSAAHLFSAGSAGCAGGDDSGLERASHQGKWTSCATFHDGVDANPGIRQNRST